MGVAGGLLLGNAIAGMFGGNEANAGEPVQGDTAEAADDEASHEDDESVDSDFGDDDVF